MEMLIWTNPVIVIRVLNSNVELCFSLDSTVSSDRDQMVYCDEASLRGAFVTLVNLCQSNEA